MIWIVLIVGTILRVISLNQSLWLDEATTALVTRMSLNDIFTKFLPGDFHPPLYYLILKYWTSIFGSSEIALRVPSLIFGVLTIYTVYLIGRKLFNEKIGIISSLFLATSGLSIYYSQEARMYSLAAFLVTLSIYLFQTKKWIFFSITLALIGLTDYVSLFILPVFLLVGYKDWKKVLTSFIPLVLSFILFLPIFIKQISGGLSLEGSAWWNILGLPTFKNIALIPVKFVLGRISFDDKVIYGVIVALVLSFFTYILSGALKKSKLLWLWLIFPTVLAILLSFKIPTLSYFRLLFVLPALYLLLAVGAKNKMFIALVLLVNIASSAFYVFNPRFHRENWKLASAAIDGQKIVFPSDSQKEALIYYGKEGNIISVDKLRKNDKDIWLSRYVWEIFDPTDSARLRIEQLGYNKVSEENFNGVVFWKYKLK
jgi:uncharacterized membrane protein